MSAFFLCGCSEMNYIQVVLPDGAIMEQVQINIDKSQVENAGMDYMYVLSCAKEEVDLRLSNPIYDRLGVLPTSSLNPYTGEVTGTITYANYNIYCDVYDIDPSEEPEHEVIAGLFYDKEIIIKSKLVYADVLDSAVYSRFVERIKLEYPDLCGFEFSDVDCYYCYGVPLDYAKVERLRSNCTYSYDQEMNSGNVRLFVWRYNHNDPDSEMVIYKNILHQWAWYAAGILFTFIFMLVLLIAHWCKKKNKRISRNAIIEAKVEVLNEEN